MADDAGALLVRSGLVSSSALDEARSRAASQGGTLGEQLVAAGIISDDKLTEFYRQRLLVPQVNPNTLARLSQKVVAAIPSDMAIELRAIPVSLDGDNNLTVAMSDPSDRHAVDEISFFTGTYVVRAVATQMQIAWCLAHYYGHVTQLGARLMQPQRSTGPVTAPTATATPPTKATAQMAAAPPPTAAPTTAPVAAATAPATATVTAPAAAAMPPTKATAQMAAAPPPTAAPTTAPVAAATPSTKATTQMAAAVPPPTAPTTAPPGREPTKPLPTVAAPTRAKRITDQIEAARHHIIAPTAGPIVNVARPTSRVFEAAMLEAKAIDDKVTESMEAVVPPAEPAAAKSAESAAAKSALAPAAAKTAEVAPATAKPAEPAVAKTADSAPDPAKPAEPAAAKPAAPDPAKPAEPDDDDDDDEPRPPPRQRAASIRPPMPDPHLDDDEDDEDDEEPLISIEDTLADDDGPRMVPVRRRVKTDPPELAARAGEVSLGDRPERAVDDQPAIIIDDDVLNPVSPVAGELRAATHRDQAPPNASIEINDDTSVSVVIQQVPDDEEDGEEIEEIEEIKEDDEDDEPVLLERRRTADVPATTVRTLAVEPAADGAAGAGAAAAAGAAASEPGADEEVVVLDTRKTPTAISVPTAPAATAPAATAPAATTPAILPAGAGRPEKKTQLGVGAHAALTRTKRLAGVFLTARADNDPTNALGRAAPPAGDDDRTDPAVAPAPPPAPDLDEDTGQHAPAPPPAPAPVGPGGAPGPGPGPVIVQPRTTTQRPAPVPPLGSLKLDEDDEEELEKGAAAGPETAVMTAVELDSAIPGRRDQVVPAHLEPPRVDIDPTDEGWGPPGTTIPPALLGAMPGIDDELGPALGEGRRIPVPSGNTAPLIVAPPAPPEVPREVPRAETSGPTLARAFDEAASRGVKLINALEHAKDRDAVITLMISHLAETHSRAGFFSIRWSTETGKAGELAVFKLQPTSGPLSSAALRLDRPSTLQDVVGTRLPYRGPTHDDASRSFLTSVLGACPPEILLVPVTVRERVVGVLFGEHRMRHTFDDQLALAARAAGMALERILLKKRS